MRGRLHLLLQLPDQAGQFVRGQLDQAQFLFGLRCSRGPYPVGQVTHLLDDGGGHDAVLFIILDLDFAPPLRLLDGPFHRIGGAVGVHDDCAFDVSRRPAHRLDEGRVGAQETLLVGVEDGDQADLRQVQPLPQEVDPHHHVVGSQPQVAQNLHPLDGVNLAVEVVYLDVQFAQIVGQVLGHALGQCGDQHALAPSHPLVDLPHQIVHLPLHRLDDDSGIHDASGADDLLHHLLALFHFVGAGGGGGVDDLVSAGLEFLEGERAVIQRRGEAKAIVNQHVLAAAVAEVHTAHLGDRHVRFVHDE